MTEDERREWWMEQAELDLQAYEAKRAEYGSADFEIMAHGMRAVAGESQDGEEMAHGFYLLGKVGRLFGAWQEGREPSDDTLKDIETYARMMRLRRAEKRHEHSRTR